MFLLYNALILLTAPIWITALLLRSWRRREAPDWNERIGNYRFAMRQSKRRVWFHAVSVGEVIAALPILRRIRDLAPDVELLLTTTTPAGKRTAQERAGEFATHIAYFPIDVLRFQFMPMVRFRPQVVAIMETELWMNFLWSAKQMEARTILVNGRISDRSYRRSQPVKPFYRALLRFLDLAAMQTPADAERIRDLGAARVEVVGNCKFDEALEGTTDSPDALRHELGLPDGLPVLVIGSTRGAEEESFVLQALRPLVGRIAVVHAPRHLDRVDELVRMAESDWGSVGRRSTRTGGSYVVLDTHGELAKTYSVADVVIVGGGFENLGGQNLLQPLAHGKPVLHGPHMANFRAVADAALEAGATQVCASPAELTTALERLLADEPERHRRGEAARKLIESNVGASERYAQLIVSSLPDPEPSKT